MGPPDDSVRVLHVDDDPDFLELASEFLSREAETFEIEIATSAEEGLEHVHTRDVDCIISDYQMPDQNGIEFLKRVRRDFEDLPFILFTGKGSEEVASDAITAGVTDYFEKRPGSDTYSLLANRIQNAVDKYRAEESLRLRDRRLNALLEHSPDWLSITDEDNIALYNSPSCRRIVGYSPEELEGTDLSEYVHPEDIDRVRSVFAESIENPDRVVSAQYRFRHKDGSWRWVEAVGRNLLNDPAVEGYVVNRRDITDRKASDTSAE